MVTIKELSDFCKLHNKYIIVHNKPKEKTNNKHGFEISKGLDR